MPEAKKYVDIGNLGTFQDCMEDWVNAKTRTLTKAEYDLLPTSEKNNGTIYYITDIGASTLEDVEWSDIKNKPIPTSGDASSTQIVMGNDTRLTNSRTPLAHTHTVTDITNFPSSLPASDVSDWAKASTKPSYTAAEVGAIDATTKGVAGGVAELDSNGLVPTSQLPSFVDDVLEYSSSSLFPIQGETGKIYVDLTTNKTYRWGGSSYVEISESLALGTTSSTAYRGDHGLEAYNHSLVTSGNPHNVTATDVGLGSPLTGAIMASSPTSTQIYSVSPAEMRKIIKQVLLGGDGTTDFTAEELANLRGMSTNSQTLSNISIETAS